jgi:outer membrane lipopolysaccharide assembly protein LptE/RlpB
MKKLLVLIALPIIVFLTGCGYHTGYSTGGVQLTSNNFKVIKKDAQGSSNAFYVFGFGGVQRKTLIADAKKDLTLKNQVKDNQHLANIVVDYKWSSFVVVSKVEAFVTADIIEFN